jgi:hypothetical protein
MKIIRDALDGGAAQIAHAPERALVDYYLIGGSCRLASRSGPVVDAAASV